MEQCPTVAAVFDAKRRIAIAVAMQGAGATAHIAAVGLPLAAQDIRDLGGGRVVS
jgi:hypothetical protein